MSMNSVINCKGGGNKYRNYQTSWMQRLCNSNPALEQIDKSRLGSQALQTW